MIIKKLIFDNTQISELVIKGSAEEIGEIYDFVDAWINKSYSMYTPIEERERNEGAD